MSQTEINDSIGSKTTNTNDNIDNLLIKHYQRLCHIVKRSDFDGYGFNLHSEKGKSGQYIGKVDDNSPAEYAGLKEGDRIIQVNGSDIGNETHKQVVQRIKAILSEVRLLVIDPIKEKEIIKQEKTILSATAITTTTSSSSSPIIPIINDNNVTDTNTNINNNNNDVITTASTITVQSTKTIITKDNASVSSSSASSSVTSSPITKIKNDNINQKLDKNNQYDNNNYNHNDNHNDNDKHNHNDNMKLSGIKNYQTNVEFIINDNTTIEPINNINHNNNNNNNINHSNNINQNGTDNHNNINDDNNENLMKNDKINIESNIMKNGNHSYEKLNDIDLSIKTTDTGNNSNNLDTTKTSINDDKKSSLNLPMTAAEMRAKLLAKKKYDPKNDSVDLRKKFEIIQKL